MFTAFIVNGMIIMFEFIFVLFLKCIYILGTKFKLFINFLVIIYIYICFIFVGTIRYNMKLKLAILENTKKIEDDPFIYY